MARRRVFYNELAARYPACRPLLGELRRRLRTGETTLLAITFEEALAEYVGRRDLDRWSAGTLPPSASTYL